eukprot:5386938-Amphidinium_carterae.1
MGEFRRIDATATSGESCERLHSLSFLLASACCAFNTPEAHGKFDHHNEKSNHGVRSYNTCTYKQPSHCNKVGELDSKSCTQFD